MALPGVYLLFFFVVFFGSNFLPAFLAALLPEMKPCQKPLGTAGTAMCRGWPEQTGHRQSEMLSFPKEGDLVELESICQSHI